MSPCAHGSLARRSRYWIVQRSPPGMRVLEVGSGPGVYTMPLAWRVASSSEDGGVTCLEIQRR